jgi:transposase
MPKRDARNLSPSQLDELRSRAITLWEKGFNRRDIAALLEVHHNSVGRWVSACQIEGPGAILSAKRGRKTGGNRSLNSTQELAIQKMIADKTPDQLKLPFALWTRRAVCDLVAARLGFSLPERTCGEHLKRWGFTAQLSRPAQLRAKPRSGAALDAGAASRRRSPSQGTEGRDSLGRRNRRTQRLSARQGLFTQGQDPIGKQQFQAFFN